MSKNKFRYCILSGSTRQESGSRALSEILQSRLLRMARAEQVTIIDLAQSSLPLWSEDIDPSLWEPYSKTLMQADGFIIVSPEWHGMATPALKNIFIYSVDEFAHKPALITALSSGNGGACPINELRSSTYKNSRICYLPEHLIIRQFQKTFTYLNLPQSIQARMEYNLALLEGYTDFLFQFRQMGIVDHEQFSFGMS